jgi:hypothetical protein
LPSLTEFDDRGQEKPVSFDKALACAFMSIEAERKKEKTFVFRRLGEEISFILQVLWPFALVEQSPKRKVMFDSLAIMKLQIRDGNVTRCEEFSEQIKDCVPSRMNREEFFKRLEEFGSFFRDFDSIKSHDMPGCFSEMKMALELASSFHLAGPQELRESIYLTPIIDVPKARELLSRQAELRNKALKDIEALKKSPLPLDSIVPKWDNQIDEEIERHQKQYDAKIDKIRPDVEAKVRDLETERDDKLAPLELEISRLEGEVRQLEEFERIHQAEETSAVDDEAEADEDLRQAHEDLQQAREELAIEEQQDYEDPSRDARISRLRVKISHIDGRISRAEERAERAHKRTIECMRRSSEASSKVYEVERILAQKREEYDDIESQYKRLIDDEESQITDLEDERDSVIDSLNQESQEISQKLDGIRKDIKDLIRRKELLMKEIDSLGMSLAIPSSKPETEIYVYIPFFVAWLKSEAGSRVLVLPPSRMKKGTSTIGKLGQFFGKIPALSEPRGQSLAKLSSLLLGQLTKDSQVMKEISGKAQQSNLVYLSSTREQLFRGIESLRSEGFLSDKIAQKLKNAVPNSSKANVPTPSERETMRTNIAQKLPNGVWCVCPKCGAHISARIEYCPCGAKLPRPPKKG